MAGKHQTYPGRGHHRKDFVQDDEEPEKVQFGQIIASALAAHVAGQLSAALASLTRAFETHLDDWFSDRGELIPYGVKPNLGRLFALAGERKLFSATAWFQLKHAKDYLLGHISIRDFDRAAFQSAAGLLLKLRVLYVFGKRAV